MKISRLFKERDPTQGSIIKNALGMSSFLWIRTAFIIAAQFLAFFWASQLGTEALAAVVIGSVVFTLMMVPVQGIVTASYRMVGSFNRQDKAGLDRLVKQILTATFIVSIFLALFGYFLAPLLLKLLGAESGIVSSAVTYVRICAIGGIVAFFLWVINGVIDSARDFLKPTLVVILIAIFHGFFGYLFILGNLGCPQMGVAGAALSLIAAAAIGAVAGFLILVTGKTFVKINLRKWSEFKPNFTIFREIGRITGLDSLEGVAREATGLVMLAIITPFGAVALAAYHIGQRLFRYVSLPGKDLGRTTAITVSNCLGEGKVQRAEKAGRRICGLNLLIMGLAGLMFFIFAHQIVGFFTQDPEVLAIGVAYLRITVFGYLFFAAGIVLRRVFAGAGHPRIPTLAHWLMLVIQIPLAWVLSQYTSLGITGVWLAILIGMIVYGLTLAILFLKGRWKRKESKNKVT